MATSLHSESIRKQFPSLQRKHNDLPMVFLDGPAGTQVPQSVIEAISHYYSTSNANTHGAFITTRETDNVIEHMRQS
ncbi:MAG TPA: aminotransferase class V-fold PLP-dependent enzyme, partial [Cyclobacteriaceae bacterium]|nr:aminotransferase class V-fold PLP-dependent enzyme [Cyclobacteriaceae bacterium]